MPVLVDLLGHSSRHARNRPLLCPRLVDGRLYLAALPQQTGAQPPLQHLHHRHICDIRQPVEHLQVIRVGLTLSWDRKSMDRFRMTHAVSSCALPERCHTKHGLQHHSSELTVQRGRCIPAEVAAAVWHCSAPERCRSGIPLSSSASCAACIA